MRQYPIKPLAVLLTLCIVFTLVPISAFAEDLTVSNETELMEALKNADCSEIKLGGSIETTWTLDVERTVTLDLNGYSLSCSLAAEDIIRVRSSGSLTIKDSGTGGKIDGQNKNCGFDVSGGTLTLESGSIVNCTDASGDGGAVDVSSTGVTETPIKYGQFIMNGGAIMDCKASDDAGAVDIGSGCTFIMNGGIIGNCRADDDGGAVFIKQSGTFELNGGTIENCSAGVNGGAVNIYGNGSFTMTGGTIKDCKMDLGGYGIAVYGKDDKAIVAILGGTIENCGVYPLSFNEFTVTFDSDGGSSVAAQKLLNSPAVKPADPKKDGCDFGGWYRGDTQYAFDTNVTENITLKAKWIPTSTSTIITAATIENANFNYQPGDVPQATATVAADDVDKYEIAYECWQEFENNNPVAAWYSDNASHGSLPTIAKFESGKEYVYFLMLKPKEGYSFSEDVTMTVNGKSVKASLQSSFLYAPAVETIQLGAETYYTVTYTDGQGGAVFQNEVHSNLKSGTKTPEYNHGVEPTSKGYIFTGWLPKVADAVTGNATYTAQWEPKSRHLIKELLSSIRVECINGSNHKLKEYDTSVGGYTAVTMEQENGKFISTITVEAKKYIDRYNEDTGEKHQLVAGEQETQTIVVEFNNNYDKSSVIVKSGTLPVTFKVTCVQPQPVQKYTVTYTDGVDNEEIFKDQTYTVESGKATPAFNGTPTRDGYKFTGWSPAVADTVTGNATYTAQWEKLTPVETFTVTYTDGVDNEEIFKDQTYTVESGKATPAFNGTPTRKEYTFTGWKPAVAATVTGNTTYEATWKV